MKPSPGHLARIAGWCYVLNIATGSMALALGRSPLGQVSSLVATAAYAAVTILFYALFKPVSVRLSRLAAVAGLVGCALGTYSLVAGVRAPIHPLACFGVYCLLIGWLIVRSTFLPRALGAALIVGGLSWLTFASPDLSRRLAPYNMVPGILVETALTLWLVIRGVNERAWLEQPRRAAVFPQRANRKA